MSLSLTRQSDGSITYCDEFESDDDIIQGTATMACQSDTRNASFAVEERHFKTSTPEMRLSLPATFGKENSSVRRDTQQSGKQRRKRALKSVYLGNQSLMGNGEKSATSQNSTRGRKKRATMSFEIYRPGDGDPNESSFHGFGQFNTSVAAPGNVSLPSPEYEPDAFFNSKEGYESSYQVTHEEQAEQLREMFPNADPAFLQSESERMKAPLGDVVNSILSHMEKNQVPAKENRKRQESSKNTKNLTAVQILKVVQDPWAYFSDTKRDCSEYSDHSLHYLKLNFRKFYNQTISDALLFHNQNLYLAYKYLKKKNRGLKLRMTNRPMSECNACKPNTVNLQFQFEVLFIEHEEEVKNYVKSQKAAKRFRLKEAARLGLLAECECCYGESLLREDVVTCTAGHTFCKECIARYIETGLKSGVGQIGCLGPCREEYPLQVVQEVLTPEIFSKLMETLDLSDVAYLARCPFCSFVMYLPPDITTVTCLNIKCLRESCRICKGSNHEPMKCEVSTPSINECWQCNKAVMKEDGCNEMVCSCGGKTCHVCRQPVLDNSHFVLYEDENGGKCPLYSTD